MDNHVLTHSTFYPHDRALPGDWTPLLSALGVFLHTYLRDLTEHQHALRPFVLMPVLPIRAALPALLGLSDAGQLAGLTYLLTNVGLLQIAESDTLIHLPQPDLDWLVVDQVLTALVPALDPEHPDHHNAYAAVRILGQAGLVQNTEPAYLFAIDGVWPDLLPVLLDDERWQRLFTHLHGAGALVLYQERARVWVVDARHERARRDQAQAELAAYLLAAQRPEEPGGSEPQPGGGGTGTPGSGPGGSEPDAPDAVAGGSPFPTVAGDPDLGATGPSSSLLDRTAVAAESDPAATPRVERPQEPPIPLSLPDADVSLADRLLRGDSLTTPDSLNNPITTTTQESPSDTSSDMRPLVARHLRAEERASTRLDAAFWREVNHVLTGSDTRYPHTPGEKKAAERQFKRQQIPIGMVLAALRAVVSLPDCPDTFADVIGSDTFQACIQAALTLLPPPSDGRDWPAFLHAYRQIGRMDGLRDVRPADYPTLQGLCGAQPERCWQVLERWAEHPPARVSPATFRRARTAGRGTQPMLPWEQPPTRGTDDPRHALLRAAGLSPRLLTPGMTEAYLRAWIAEADARAQELTSRIGWLTWGIRSGHWPAAHPQLRQRRLPVRSAPPTPAPTPPAPVSAEQAVWQAVWSVVQTRLMAHVPTQDYATWLHETALVDLDRPSWPRPTSLPANAWPRSMCR